MFYDSDEKLTFESSYNLAEIMDSLITLFTDRLGLNRNQFDTFFAQLKVKSLKKKELLISEGSVCNFIGFVSSGTLRSYVKNNDGEFNNDFYFDHDFVSAYTSFLTQMPTNCNIDRYSGRLDQAVPCALEHGVV